MGNGEVDRHPFRSPIQVQKSNIFDGGKNGSDDPCMTGSGHQSAAESRDSRDSDPHEICLPQKKAVPKCRVAGGHSTLTVEVERRRSSGTADDDDDDDADNDVDDVSSSDSTSDIDTAACCSEVRFLRLITVVKSSDVNEFTGKLCLQQNNWIFSTRQHML